MDALSKKDLEIFQEKARAFHGSVKVPLDRLQSEDFPDNPRHLDEKNVSRLVDSFSRGCYRLEPENHVPIKISASQSAKIPPSADLQLFIPEHPLEILHGQHRIEAARRFFTGHERWWVADLYSEDLSAQATHHIREHDLNSARFYDGDILRQIFISIERGDEERKERFLDRLSASKQEWVTRLLAQPDDLLCSFRALIPFRGLWPALQIGTFPRLFNLHCPEEMAHYIRRVRETWSFIIGQHEEQIALIDPNTVFLLQGRCPAFSFEDNAFVHARMLAGELFPAVKDQSVRSQILNRLLSIEHVVPSIHTFLEDTKHLEPCARILKKLLPNRCRASLSQHFDSLHAGQASVKVQTGEFEYDDRTLPSSSHASRAAYRQLWLFALRHFRAMGGKPPRKDTAKSKSWHSSLQFRWWVEMSTLAAEAGYKRIQWPYRDRRAADLSIIEDCIRRIHPLDYYEVDQEQLQREVRLIYNLIDKRKPAKALQISPELTSDEENSRPGISDKCGRPRASTYKADEKFLFLDHIYNAYDVTPKRYLTSFAITRDFFHKFFGTAEENLDQLSFRANRTPEDHHNQVSNTESRPMDLPDALHPPSDPMTSSNSHRELPTSEARASPVRQGSESGPRPVDEQTETRLTLYDDPGSRNSERRLTRHPRQRANSASARRERRQARRIRRHTRRGESQPGQNGPPIIRGIVETESDQEMDDWETDASMETAITPSEASAPAAPTAAPTTAPALMEQSSNPSTFILEQHTQLVTASDASRLLYSTMQTQTDVLTVLYPNDSGFQVRQIKRSDTVAMVSALGLSEQPRFLVGDWSGQGSRRKRLKLIAGTEIQKAAAEDLGPVIRVPQDKTAEVMRQFEDLEDEEKELPHKAPQRGHEVPSSKPITIMIHRPGRLPGMDDYQRAESNVIFNRVNFQKKITEYLSTHEGYVPLDVDGNEMPLVDVFDLVQERDPSEVYLGPPDSDTL